MSAIHSVQPLKAEAVYRSGFRFRVRVLHCPLRLLPLAAVIQAIILYMFLQAVM